MSEKKISNAVKKKEVRSASLTLRGDLTPKLLSKLREESLHSTSPKEALMSAISASFQDLSQLGQPGEGRGDSFEEGEGSDLGLAPELVVEVNSVLSKLMNSLNENLDPELIPTIKDLQATLNTKKRRAELESRFRRQVPLQDHVAATSSSKVPWKIRAARKRAIKHHTTGMTKDEFQIIKNSLQESAKTFTSIPAPGYALSRNKSESAIRSHTLGDGGTDSKAFHGGPIDPSSQASDFTPNGPHHPRPLDAGYASDVCDYNINSSSNNGTSGKSLLKSPASKDNKPEPSSTLESKEKLSKTSEKPPRRAVKSNSGSAVKARIDRRKRMRHANAIDNPHGSLSDQESSMMEATDEEEYEDSVSENQKNRASSCDNQKTSKEGNINNGGSSSELTPETNRRKNWNSRFSNIKNAFVSEEEIFQKSRSPSINRDNSNASNAPSSGKKADDKYMNLILQARLENNRSRSRNSTYKNPNDSSGGEGPSSSSLGPSNNSSKSKQPTPNRDHSKGSLSPLRLSKSLPKESRAEAMGLEPANKNKNDMDYQEYMNIISRVRRTKESTRVRTEQIRLASMYAQEQRRQEEIKREEERLKLEREKVQKDLERQKQMMSMPKRSIESQKVVVEASTSPVIPSEKVSVRREEESPQANVLLPPPSENKASTEEDALHEQTLALLQEQARQSQEEQKRQQELREEQVKAEQEKLERLRQEQIRQEKEREEIHRLEFERLKQIQEEQRRLDEERRVQSERIRLEQVRLEEERKRQETLQAERNAEYNRQRLDMEAQNVCLPQETRAKLLRSPTAAAALAPVVSLASNKAAGAGGFTPLSPEEKIIQKRLSDQETLRRCHKAEESKIRQEKMKLIQQEEMLVSRQEEMLRQVESGGQNLFKQEQLIRSRQQGRLTQVRQEKMLLEKQEEMLQMREKQLIEERIRQEKLRMEQKSLREQEEVIRKRQEQISKELMGEISMAKNGGILPFPQAAPPAAAATNDSSAQSLNGVEDEDTLDEESSEEEEEFYESTVEVKQKSTSVPTSVRTIGLANTHDKPWAPVTPYLSTYERQNNSNPTPPSEMFNEDDVDKFKPSGIITSPESLRTSSTLITTPDETSLQLSPDCYSSNTPTFVPPLPFDEGGVFRPLQHPQPYEAIPTSTPLLCKLETDRNLSGPYQLSPKIGGPGSAFKPYSSSENLHDPSLFPLPSSTTLNQHHSSTNLLLPPTYPSAIQTNGGPKKALPPPVHHKVKELRRPIRAPFSTTDTEPEMKECHFPPEKNKRSIIKQHPYKPSYSTSETEDDSAYHSRRTKWFRHHHHNQNHQNNHHHNNSHDGSKSFEWDPFQVESPPQITQKPVGIIQKPKPQHVPSTVTLGSYDAPIPSATISESLYQQPLVIERGAEVYKDPSSAFFNAGGSDIIIKPAQPDNTSLASLLHLPPVTSEINALIPKSLATLSAPSDKEEKGFKLPPPSSASIQKQPPPPPQSEAQPKKEDYLLSNLVLPTLSLLTPGTSNNSLYSTSSAHDGLGPSPHSPIVKDENPFDPPKVIRVSSFSSFPSRNSTEGIASIASGVHRQSSYNSIPTIEKLPLPLKEQEWKNSFTRAAEPPSTGIKTAAGGGGVAPPSSQLQEELQKKLEARKISTEERLRKQSKQEEESVVPLTVVEMSSTKKPSEDGDQKKKTLQKRIVNEAVTFKNESEGGVKKIIPRNNLTITAMEIMTGGEIKTCEMEERLMREKYGTQSSSDEVPSKTMSPPVSPLKTSPKPVMASKPAAASTTAPPPKIILKKEPKRLEPEEIRARKSSTEKQPEQPSRPMDQKKEARVISASNVITRSNNGVVEKKKEEYIENLSKSSSAEEVTDESSRAARIKREKVKKAAERFEKTASPIKSGSQIQQSGDKLPWNEEAANGKPKLGILRRRETFRKNGYALRMSKSSDSITASKFLSKNSSGLRINEVSQNPDEVTPKTKDEIRHILSIAKQSSVTERIKIFNNQILGDIRSIDEEDHQRDRKAEAIKKEILSAKMSAAHENSGGDSPVQSRRSSLQILKRNPSSESKLRINQPSGSDALRQKLNGRKLSEPALNGSVKSRIENYMGGGHPKTSSSSGKPKEPKLLLNSISHSIYAQSATDYSATEEETDHKSAYPSMDYLQVPSTNGKKRELRRSKSFASSGQYECVLSDEEVDEKTRQMMAFFNTSPGNNNNNNSKPPLQTPIRVVSDEPKGRPLKSALKTRQLSHSEDALEDEDLRNVDDIFERLLVKNEVEGGESFGGEKTPTTTIGVSGRASSYAQSGTTKRILHHRSHHGSSNRILGSSHEHLSSSPTQSEYESCDPWDDY